MDAYPNVTSTQKRLIEKYRSFITNTGGNDPEDLLQRLQGPGGEKLAQSNIIVWAMAYDIKGQVALLNRLEGSGKFGLPEDSE